MTTPVAVGIGIAAIVVIVLAFKTAKFMMKLILMLAALIRARREHTYEIDLTSLMLTSEEWIPLEGVQEAPLVRALVAQGRRFVKPRPPACL